MRDQLIQKFNEFNGESYYQKIDSSIDEILNSYTNIRNDPGLTADDKHKALSDHNNRISAIISTSGISAYSSAPFEFEKEFFTSGELDETRFKNFKRSVLHHLSGEEMKWIFAGTTQSYTRITQKALEKQNISLSHLLPKEMTDSSKSLNTAGKNQSSPGAYRVFVYPDGTLSSGYESSRAQFSFEQTKDKSGVPWQSSYRADMEIEKKSWGSGFNKNGEWERFAITSPEIQTASLNARTLSPVISFSPQINNDIEYLYVINTDSENGILCDEEGLLITEQEEKFYTITGELYAGRKTDPEGTAENLKLQLQSKGIESLSAVIVPDLSENTRSAYKKMLGEMINSNTRFRTAADPETHSYMQQLRESIKEDRASSELISRYRILLQEGFSGDELYNALEHENVSPVIEKKLSIFSNDKDLETFITIPAVNEIINEETISYLQTLDIPEDKISPMSNAVQNLLLNYASLFRYTGLTPKDIISRTHETVVQGNGEKSSKIIIPGECTLYDYIRQQAPEIKNTTIPAFHSAAGKETLPDLFDDNGFLKWQKESAAFLNADITQLVKKTLSEANIEKSKQVLLSGMIVSVFQEFKAIQENTGITPSELTNEIISVFKGRPSSASGNKRILFSKTFDRLIEEASAGTKYTEGVHKSSLLNQVKASAKVAGYDLFNKEQLMEFVSSPVFASYGFSSDETDDFSEGIMNISIPDIYKPAFVKNLMNVLPLYKNNMTQHGYSIKKMLSANSSFAQNSQSPDALQFAEIAGLNRISNPTQTPSEKFIFAAGRETLLNELQNSSLTGNQITGLLEQYKNEFSSYPGQNLHRVVLNYRNASANTTKVPDNSGRSDYSDLGWKTVHRQGMEPMIIPLLKSAHNKQPGKISRILQNAQPGENLSLSFPDKQGSNTTGFNEQMVYTSPAVRASSRTAPLDNPFIGNSHTAQAIERKTRNYSDLESSLSQNEHPSQHEDIRMQRINENYDYDKRRLAKPDEGGSSGGQGSAGAKSKGGADLKRTIEALYDEFKNDIQKSN